jgi:DNA mismatch repair protein MutS
MRSTIVTTLLANCGLFVACDKAVVPWYDYYFLRTSSYDIPTEAKSAFALEINDIKVMTDECTSNSLVMMDEIGKI